MKATFTQKLLAALLLLTANNAFAQSMPWESPFQTLLSSISGPTARMAVVAGIVVGALSFAMGEGGPVFKTAIRIVSGGAIALGAASLSSTLFV